MLLRIWTKKGPCAHFSKCINLCAHGRARQPGSRFACEKHVGAMGNDEEMSAIGNGYLVAVRTFGLKMPDLLLVCM